MKTKKLTLLIATVFIFTYLLSMTVFAANVCSRIDGTVNSTTSFTIKTDKKWLTSNSVTLTQTKGRAEGLEWIGAKPKKYSLYGRYTVHVTDKKGNTEKYTWTDGNFTIKNLKANSSYTVKVVPRSERDYINATSIFHGGFYGWSQPATWYVKKTSGLTLCN